MTPEEAHKEAIKANKELYQQPQNNVVEHQPTTEEIISDFYFIVFSPNPNHNNVKVIIDDGTVKLYMNIKKFIKIIKTIMDEDTSIIVNNCCDSYGGFYLIDRNNKTVSKLSLQNEKGLLNIKKLHNDIMTAKNSSNKNENLRNEYIKALTKTADNEIRRGTKIDSIQNPYSATVLYGQEIIKGGYRPY